MRPEGLGGALQVAQYSFVFWNSTGPDRAQRRFLFPLGDLANHKCAPKTINPKTLQQ